MLAAHADQENLIHAQRTAGAAKSLNRSFGAKTPGVARGPKTPFKVSLNDENVQRRANGKSGAKTIGGKEFVNTKGGKADQNAFVTPAGPRTRAPLGFKTTNAKATAFQTPAPQTVEPQTQGKTLSPRLHRKVKIHQPEPVQLEDEDEFPEPEYMAPRSVPLPDVPSDDDLDDLLSPPGDGTLASGAVARSWVQRYMNPIDDDGVSRLEKKDAREKAQHDAYVDAMLEQAMNAAFAETEEALREDMGISPKKSMTPHPAALSSPLKPKPARKHTLATPGTLLAKSAASALGAPPAVSARPSYAATTSTATLKAVRAPLMGAGGVFGKKLRESAKAANCAVTTGGSGGGSRHHHGAALAASRSTLGYGKGRSISQKIHPPRNAGAGGAGAQLQSLHNSKAPRSVSASAALQSSGGKKTTALTPARAAALKAREAEEELRLRVVQEEDELDIAEAFGGVPRENLLDDDEYEGFQLQLPSLG